MALRRAHRERPQPAAVLDTRDPHPAERAQITGDVPALGVSELATDMQGALSPFGEWLELPLPADAVRYHHPRPEDRPRLVSDVHRNE